MEMPLIGEMSLKRVAKDPSYAVVQRMTFSALDLHGQFKNCQHLTPDDDNLLLIEEIL